jgi:undecaprenyl-diphosphatase
MDALIIFGATYLIAVPVLVLLAYILFSRGKKLRQLIWLSVLSLPVAFITAKLAGLLYYDPLPFVEGNFKPLIAHAANNGFPSDHTLLAATIATVLLYVDAKSGIALWIIALLIGISRVAAGVHHITDIVGAMGIAVLAVLLSQFVIGRLRARA